MTTVTDDLEIARQVLAKTDDCTSLEAVLREVQFSVDETPSGPVTSFDVEGESVPLSDLAIKTFATTLEVPQNYLMKCPAHLQADNLNYWKGRLSERKRVRVVVGEDRVQALTSPNFLPVKNLPLLEALVERLGKGDPSKIKLDAFEHDWLVTRIGLCHADASHEVKNGIFKDQNPEEHVGDVVRAGVNMMNSLTNQLHTEVSPFVYRLFCANRMVTPLVGGSGDGFRYDPKAEGAPTEWLATMIDEIGKQFDPLFEHLDSAAVKDLPDPEMALTAQLGHVPGTLREAVLEAYKEEPTPTVWGVVNALTRAANGDEVDGRFRRRVQSHAGTLAMNRSCEECGRPLDQNHDH